MASHSQLPSSLHHFDMSKILMLDSTLTEAPNRLRTNKQLDVHIRGDVDEIETTLDACLQVQRWDRALALLKQLEQLQPKQLQPKGSARLLAAYNHCLEKMVFDMLVNKNKKTIHHINRWVEVDMGRAGVRPDARTYALRIKVALATLQGAQRDRTVQRYWDLAKENDIAFEVASLREILTDRDLGKLSEICPSNLDFNLEPEAFPPEEAIEVLPTDTIASKIAVAVREAGQKGFGLSALRKSLSLFSNEGKISREDFQGTPEEIDRQFAEARQSRLETDSVNSAVERWRIEHEKMAKMGIVGSLERGKLGATLWQWHQVLLQKLEKEMELIESAENKSSKTPQDKLRSEYGPFLRLLNPKHLSATTIITVIQTMNKQGMGTSVKLVHLVTELGKQVEAETQAALAHVQIRFRRATPTGQKTTVTAKKLAKMRSQARAVSSSDKAVQLDKEHSKFPSSESGQQVRFWSTAIHARVGALLCELLFDSAMIKVSKQDNATDKVLHITQSAFIRNEVYRSGRKVGTVAMDPSIVEILGYQPVGDVIAKQLPMISQPKPWTSFLEGGYLTLQQNFLRIKLKESAQRDYTEAAAARGDLDQLFAGINVLGRTGWKINRDVFKVMLDAWNSGEAIANLPPAKKTFPDIPLPADTDDKKTRYALYQARRAMENEKNGLHSNRCFQNFQMEIAKAFLDETFYLPHNVDFRGRAYPIPPYLNQMGADNCRGLLLFDNGRALGSQGLRWLKIHLANVFGYDKASLSDREHFSVEHWDDIQDAVVNPLRGKRWWLTAEDPWQCLATCIELVKALALPDPTQYISHLPVHQDGSCNGLQHYAALGGDIAGARQVNLEPGDKPADVYTGVAELVKAEIKEDAASGDVMAKMLDGKITRKIVKQTVMTNVYGVTFLGAIRQVRRQVDDLLPEFKTSSPPLSGVAATYIARKIFKALGAMFTGAHNIQYWLGDCANRISTSLAPAQLQKIATADGATLKTRQRTTKGKQKGDSRPRKANLKSANSQMTFRSGVIWTTPLKLPVVQPYRIAKGQCVKTALQDITLAEPTIADAVNKRKQLQAFPPNFIHSLDATHMVLSALKCDEHSLTFSAVHDSFWTHAADVDTLNRLLREAFIRMHSEDIVGRLAAEFKTRYDGHLYLAHVEGKGRLAEALQDYRRALTYPAHAKPIEKQQHELLMEIKKRNLMRSEDPEEREAGEKIVTAATLFEQLGGEKCLHHKDSLGETAIGKIPQDLEEATIKTAMKIADENKAENVDITQSIDPLVQGSELHETRVIEAEAKAIDSHSDMSRKKSTVKGAGANKTTWVWLPLTFRAVPPKVCCFISHL